MKYKILNTVTRLTIKNKSFQGEKLFQKILNVNIVTKFFIKIITRVLKLTSNFRTEEKILLGVSDYLKIINIIKDLGGKKNFSKKRNREYLF